MSWVLGGVISLGMTYILIRVIIVIVNINSLLSVRTRLCNGNLVKFCLWCPLSSLPCFLVQLFRWKREVDVDRGKEKQAFCAVLLKDTQLYQRFHSNHEIIISESDYRPPKASAKYPSTWHWVPGVAARRTINLEVSKPWKSASGLLHPRHHKNLWCINEEPAWEGRQGVRSALQTDARAEKHKNNTESVSLGKQCHL